MMLALLESRVWGLALALALSLNRPQNWSAGSGWPRNVGDLEDREGHCWSLSAHVKNRSGCSH
jgi:hypothetical protein